MGNTISEPNGELYDTVLANMVNNWALTKYKMDLPNTSSYQNLLKKRACCTKQVSIPISIPSYDESKKKLEFSSVKINVFTNESEITPTACSFENDRTGKAKEYYFQNNSGFIIANQNCEAIYPTICNAVLNDRQNYDNDYTRHYGPYADTPGFNNNGINKVNTFIDCNCNNSLYLSDVLNAQTANNVNPNSLAQSLDTRCSMNSTKTYKTVDDRVANLCLNNINVTGDIGVNNDAQLGITQSCSSSSQQARNQAPAQQVMPAQPEVAPAPAPAPAPEVAPEVVGAQVDAPVYAPVTPEAPTEEAPTEEAPTEEAPTEEAPTAEASMSLPEVQASSTEVPIETQTKSNNKTYIIVGLVILLICIIMAIYFFMKK
jgi:hypothetical protein